MGKGTGPIGVIGLGNWGTALAHHLAREGNTVVAWTRDQVVRDSINREHRHPHCFSGLMLDGRISATTELADISQCALIVYALPSSSLTGLVPKLNPAADTVVVSAVKGLERKTCLTTLQLFGKHFVSGVKTAVISGPSFAVDVVNQRPCGLVAASADSATSQRVAELFSGPSVRVYTSSDPIGVEMGGVVKNVIAVAAGICDGLELGESARAGLITRGLAEMMRFAETLGGDRATLSGLSGLGDLIMTATSSISRNHTLGYRLGRGEKLSDIISSLGSVAEAAVSAPLVMKIAKERGIEMPISAGVVAVLTGEVTAPEMLTRLMQRPLKSE